MDFDSLERQRHLARLLLDAIGAAGFALAGAGAIREHGLTGRPTQDVDLFTSSATTPDEFEAALSRAERRLGELGYRVERVRSAALFARLVVHTPAGALAVDLAVDWRQFPPVQLDVGPVLSVTDAVASKIAAVYSRGEARDYLDLDTIRESGRFSDTELLRLAREHDTGFELATFVDQLRGVDRLVAERTTPYGTDEQGLDKLKHRLTGWADQLEDDEATPPTGEQARRE